MSDHIDNNGMCSVCGESCGDDHLPSLEYIMFNGQQSRLTQLSFSSSHTRYRHPVLRCSLPGVTVLQTCLFLRSFVVIDASLKSDEVQGQHRYNIIVNLLSIIYTCYNYN